MFSHMTRSRTLGFLLLSLAAGFGAAQEGGDLQARIVYAFQAEDTNELTNLVQTLTNQVKSGGADAALRYHLAHAQYRFGLLGGAKRSRDAPAAFSVCLWLPGPPRREYAAPKGRRGASLDRNATNHRLIAGRTFVSYQPQP